MIPAKAIELAKLFEGCRLSAYRCPAGVWTIGWGSTGPDIKPGLIWTQPQCDERLEQDIAGCVTWAAKLSPGLLLDEPRLAAITDFIYNLGPTRYKSSTLRAKVNAKDWVGAVEQINKWTRAGGRVLPGLVARRATEAKLLS